MLNVVVIGGGFGGLKFLQRARSSKIQFTLIDKQNHHLFQPLLYQVATAVLSPANIAFPRQVAMYLSRILTEHSLQEIGAAFGGRDHGTVIHACKTVENMMDQDDSIKHSVELLNEQLSQVME